MAGGGGDQQGTTASWSQATLDLIVVQGTYHVVSLQLTSSDQIDDVTLVASGELAAMVRVDLTRGSTLLKGSNNAVSGDVIAAASVTPGTYQGTISALSASRGPLASLPVRVQVRTPSSTEVPAQIADPTPDRISRTASGQYAVKDEIVVVLSSTLTNPGARIIEIAMQIDAQIVGSVPGMSVYQLRFATIDEAVIGSQVDTIAAMAGVDAASASLLGSNMKFASEGLYPADSWSLTTAQGANRHLEIIRAPLAWDVTTGSTGSAAVPVAIIDTEFDSGHPDLVGNIQSSDTPPSTYVGTRPSTVSGGHGTSVAGTLCARATDSGGGIGVAGVAWSCGLRLYEAKGIRLDTQSATFLYCRLPLVGVIGNDSCFSLLSLPRFIESMRKAVADGAKVVNLSQGFIEVDCQPNCTPESSQLAKLARQVNGVLRRGFDEGVGKNVLWVIAAGNENRDVQYQAPASFKKYFPAFADQIIVVAGTFTGEIPQSANSVSPEGSVSVDAVEVGRFALGARPVDAGSNFGSAGDVDIAAPWFVSSTLPRYCTGHLVGCDSEPLTSFGTSSYAKDNLGGTSFSAPIVAGVAVLVWSRQPTLTAAQVKQCIVRGTRIRVTGHDFKVVDAKRAVDCEIPTNAPTTASLVASRGFTCGVTNVGVTNATGLNVGGAKCWGFGGSGALGNGSNQSSLTPAVVVGLSSGVTAMAAGTSHTCAVTSTGAVKCWGIGPFGELGDGTGQPRLAPVDVVGLGSDASAVAAGFDHSCAITGAGEVKCWGGNPHGEIGDGTQNQNRLQPVSVSGLSSGMSAVSAGAFFTCALTSPGGVKCWGINDSGQLGDGTSTERLVPVDVIGLTSGVIAISAGSSHVCALTTEFGVKCWGSNSQGQLGRGDYVNSSTPVVALPSGSGATALSAGTGHSCAVIGATSVKCWGAGPLGDGTQSSHPNPSEVPGLVGIAAVAAGEFHTCVTTAAGAVSCWGANSAGQLGDGTTVDRPQPVALTGF